MTIHRSRFPDVVIPEASITEVVFAGLAGREDAPALIDGPSGRALTGRQLMEQSRALAGGLTARGYGAGHVVALMAPNLPEFAVVFHGVAWAGGTITTINPSYTAEEVRFQLRDSGAELLVTVPAILATARAAADGTGVREIAVIGAAEGALSLAALMGAPIAAQVPVDLRAHVVVLPYSSGTTGLPKGVMLTHANLVANIAQFQAVRRPDPGERTLAVLPFFHIYGMMSVLNNYLSAGGVVVTLPRFDLETALRLVQEHRMRRLFLVPPIVLALARHPLVDRFDLSSLEFINSGAAPLGAELEGACAARLGCEVFQGYGMTEMSPVSHLTPPRRSRAGSSGTALPSTLCRVVDPETWLDAATGEVGELWIKGPQVMLGYLNRPEATAASIVEDGWLRTGDLVRIDADGYLFVLDRVKELIKVKGFQVPPAELEALLLDHPSVADVAVIGLPDVEAGEVPVAFVVRAAGADPCLEELQGYLAAHIASYKQIRRVDFVEAIPKSPSGKILRRMLRGGAPV